MPRAPRGPAACGARGEHPLRERAASGASSTSHSEPSAARRTRASGRPVDADGVWQRRRGGDDGALGAVGRGRVERPRSPRRARACSAAARPVWHEEAPQRARRPARSASSPAARAERVGIAAASRRRGRASRPWTSSAPWPGAGTNTAPSSGVAVTSSRPSRASPAAASTSASTSPAASLRSRVSTLPRSSTTSRSGRTASSCARRRSALVPTRAPGASASSDGAPTSTSRGSSRAGTAAIAVPGASSPGTSLALWTARSISPASSARSSAPVQRDLSPTSRGEVARRRDLDDLGIRAEPLRDPARLRQRERAAARPEPQAQGRRSSRTSPPGCSATRRVLEPEQLAQQRQPRVAAVGVERPQPLRRLVQQPLDGGAQHRLDALAVALGHALPALRVLGEQLLDQPVGLLAQRGDRRQHLERPEPAGERLDLLLDDALGAARLDPALVVRARDLRLQAVDVDERDAGQRRALGIDVARHREVEQQQRPPAARLGDERQLLGADDRVRRGGRGDDDVGPLELAPAARRTRSCRRRSAARARSPARAGGWRRTSSRRPARSARARSARPSRPRR